MLKEAKECDAMIGKERWRRDEVKKQTGESKTVREHTWRHTPLRGRQVIMVR